jgi:hypothetical protein
MDEIIQGITRWNIYKAKKGKFHKKKRKRYLARNGKYFLML